MEALYQNNLELIYQISGLAFFVLGVVVIVMPSRKTILSFSPHLAWLAAFGMLHGLQEFAYGEQWHNSSVWVITLRTIFQIGSFAALFEFGRRVWNEIPGINRLTPPWVYSILVPCVILLALWTDDPLVGLDAGIRYFLGMPGAFLSGIALIMLKQEEHHTTAEYPITQWLLLAAIALIIYGILIIFHTSDALNLPMRLPSTGDFSAFTGLPIQMPITLSAVLVSAAFIMLIHYASKLTADIAQQAIDADLRIKEAAISSSLNAIAMANLEGKLTYVNRSFCRLWQIDSPEYALGKSALDFWDDPEKAQNVIEALHIQGHWQGELLALRQDGSTAELELSAHMVQDADGNPICMMSSFVDISAHKRDERKLQQSQALLNSIIMNIPAMVFLKSAEDLKFELLNHAGEELLGYPQDDLLGKSDYDFFPPEQASYFTAKDREVLDSGRQLDIAEESIKTRDGEIRFLHTCKTGVYDSSGRPTHLLGISIDITEIKNAQAAVQRERDFATSLVDTAPVIILLLDTQGIIQHANPYFEQLSGYVLEEIKGRNWFDCFIPERDQARIRALFELACQDVPNVGNINSIVIQSGEELDVEWWDRVQRDQHGKITGLLVIGMDVTERINMNNMLIRREEELSQFKAMLDQTADCMFMFDTEELRFFYVNQGAINQVGYSQAELMKMHPYDIKPDFTERQFRDFIAPLLSGEQSKLAFETVHQHKNGNRIPVDILLQCITTTHGQPARFIAVVRDVTERKHAEEKLINLNQQLEHRVQMRTADLKVALTEAERASATKSEFLSRMSHELRTPLNAIIGFGQLLETDPEHPLSETQVSSVREIREAGRHLLELVNEVLDLSRIEQGHLEIEFEPVKLGPLIEACLSQIHPMIMQQNLKVSLDLDAVCTVLADRMRLKDVLLNLLSNAIKFNFEGGSITIRCASSRTDYVRISIRDTGRGIAEDALSQLFKPFERIESAYNGIEGTGIGLALSKKLIEAMQGKIGVESVPSEGSTFWIELPLAKCDESITDSNNTHTTPCARNVGNHKVLCIEDNLSNLILIQKILASRNNIELFEASSGELGLEIAMREPLDLILIDINLPGINGFEVLRRLKSDSLTKDIPMVALTANAMKQDIELAREVGFDDYLTKPIDVINFLDTVDRYLRVDM